MGKTVLFAFEGTGGTANTIKNFCELWIKSNDVVRIYFSGCQEEPIGGRVAFFGRISPDLDHVSSSLYSCFSDNHHLSLVKLKEIFGDSVQIVPDSALKEESLKVDKINLTGFSRGAVTTFSAARYLDSLGIPMYLLAEDPVVGESRENTKSIDSLYARNTDLSACKNLIEAEVVLGQYSKNINALHNKYLRQMAPKFNEQTDAVIYTVPKPQHYNFSFAHKQAFFSRHGYSQSTDSEYAAKNAIFVPKVAQQKFHFGVIGRTEVSPYIKVPLFNLLINGGFKLTKSDAFKLGQAAYVLLNHHYNQPSIPKQLLVCVLNDRTIKGIGVREFVVEMHSIIEFCKTKGKLTESQLKDIQLMMQALDNQLECFIQIKAPSVRQFETFENDVKGLVGSLSNNLPSDVFNSLVELTAHYLQENTITHPHLAAFLDETETFVRGNKAYQRAYDESVSTASELAYKLYYSSERQRVVVYEESKAILPNLVTSLEDLVNLGQVLSVEQLSEVMDILSIREKIRTGGDLCQVMERLLTYEHRKVVFKAILETIPQMQFTLLEVLQLMDYLSADKCKQLVEKLTQLVGGDDDVNIHHFFEQLSVEKQNIVMQYIHDKEQSLEINLANPLKYHEGRSPR